MRRDAGSRGRDAISVDLIDVIPARTGWLWMAALLVLALAAFQRTSAQPVSELSEDVFTPLRLRQAVVAGVKHVVIKEHLDLRSPQFTDVLELTTTDSIVGACNSLGAPDVYPPRVGKQCVLELGGPLLRAPPTGTLFIHLLYVIVRTRSLPVMMNVITTANSSMFITDSTLVGDGIRSRGIDVVSHSRVYAWGSQFVMFKAEDSSAIRVGNNSEGTMHSCTFTGNTVSSADGFGPVAGVMSDTGDIWFENCTFSNNLSPLPGDVAVLSSVNWICSSMKGEPSVYDQDLNGTIGPRHLQVLPEEIEDFNCTYPGDGDHRRRLMAGHGAHAPLPMACREFPLPTDDGYISVLNEAVNSSGGDVAGPSITPLPELTFLTFEDPYHEGVEGGETGEPGPVQSVPSPPESLDRVTVAWIAAGCVVAALLALFVVGVAAVVLRKRPAGTDGESQGLKGTESGFGPGAPHGMGPGGYGSNGVPGPPGMHPLGPGGPPNPGSSLTPPNYYLESYRGGAAGGPNPPAPGSAGSGAHVPASLMAVGGVPYATDAPFLDGAGGGGSTMSGGPPSVASNGLPPAGVRPDAARSAGAVLGGHPRPTESSDPLQPSIYASTEAPPSELDMPRDETVDKDDGSRPRVHFQGLQSPGSSVSGPSAAQAPPVSDAFPDRLEEETSADMAEDAAEEDSRPRQTSGPFFGLFGSRSKPKGNSSQLVKDVTMKFDRTFVPETSADGITHEQVADMLDEVYGQQVPFDGKYWLLGSTNRRLGGAGVLQFAREASEKQGPGKRPLGPEDVALKYFVQRAPFDRVIELFTNPKVQPLMPAVIKLVHNNAGVKTADQVLPPCMVMQRGESMEDWVKRTKPNLPASLNALVQVVELLKDLHAAGYVYYAMKPTNVAWYREEQAWKLIDFGLTARQGNRTGLSFSLNYAAPEVINALEANSKTIEVSPATDMWALGVVAWELLSQKRTFPPGTPPNEIKAQIAGREALPWEARDTKQLRTLKNSVLQCLSRDMDERPSAAEVHAAWTNLLDFAAVQHTEVAST